MIVWAVVRGRRTESSASRQVGIEGLESILAEVQGGGEGDVGPRETLVELLVVLDLGGGVRQLEEQGFVVSGDIRERGRCRFLSTAEKPVRCGEEFGGDLTCGGRKGLMGWQRGRHVLFLSEPPAVSDRREEPLHECDRPCIWPCGCGRLGQSAGEMG